MKDKLFEPTVPAVMSRCRLVRRVRRSLKTIISNALFILILFTPDVCAAEPVLLLGGDYPDPTIIRDGDDYYMTHSAFDCLPGLTVWHSRDLQHWAPISYALTDIDGSVWAPDISKHNGKYYIYFTVAGGGRYRTFVVTASDIRGPWTKPVDVGTDKLIDPGHIVDAETGTRWLYMSRGFRYRLSDDGLKVVGDVEHIYDGWRMPDDWQIESYSLEGPKLLHIGRYYYWLSALGGTAGPPTSHCVAVARSEKLEGPWENSPFNPLVHTFKATERWWSKGHGSLVDDGKGGYWVVYHAYENGFTGLGRQTLIERVTLGDDGWFHPIASSDATSSSLPGKVTVERPNCFDIGLHWKFFRQYDESRFEKRGDSLMLRGTVADVGKSSPLLFVAGCHRYEYSVKFRIEGDAKVGLILFYNPDYYVAYTVSDALCEVWKNGRRRGTGSNKAHYEWLKIRNDNNVVTGYRSADGVNWQRDLRCFEMSGYNHHTLEGFLSLLPGLFVTGEGRAVFSDFRFTELTD
ncbi:MAG: family 43 glycosylhydrolase [Prevotella sp.]